MGLQKIGIDPSIVITVYNKIDKLKKFEFPRKVVKASFKLKIGVDEILNEIELKIRGKYQIRRFLVRSHIRYFEQIKKILENHHLNTVSVNNYTGQAFDENQATNHGELCSIDEVEFEFYCTESDMNIVKSKFNKLNIEFVVNYI